MAKKMRERYPYYMGKLGVECNREKTTFRVWAPTAEKIKVKIYEDENSPIYLIIKEMNKVRNGCWQISINGDLNSKYFTYLVYVNNRVNEVVDPYVRALSTDSKRGLLFLKEEAEPSGWSADRRIKCNGLQDTVIYELHIRDFSYSPDSGIKNKLLYKAFTEKNTITPGGNYTGISHLQELGITHVQLMPVFDFASVSDNNIDEEYNWGYDPFYYNVPEGSYASNSSDLSRIKELKLMIKSLHDTGIGVIMDVVYNHTYYYHKSPFNLIIPDYFYRFYHNGERADGSGCGNEIATEKSMVRRFILDSICYWVEEYHIDGFRFDLMGLMDKKTAYSLREALDRYNPSVLMYGEPWAAGPSPLIHSNRMVPGAQKGKRIGFFNDLFRNAIKGDNDGKGRGFVSGASSGIHEVKKGIVGEIEYNDHLKGFALEPGEVINYVSSHDNLTLWDKLKRSNSKESIAKRIKMDLLSQAIIILSQGGVFIHGGEEFLRCKYGWENSYRAGDSVNCLKWIRKDKFYSVFLYYQGLIKLRNKHPAFRMKTSSQIKNNLYFFNSPGRTIAFMLKGYNLDDSWDDIVVIFNAEPQDVKVQLPFQNSWEVVVASDKAGTETLYSFNGGKKNIEALSTLVIHS